MGKLQVRPRAVFLDRDGVLNQAIIREGKPYPPGTLSEFTLCEGVVDGCLRLKAAGFFLVVITNQPDVGRGIQERTTVESMHRRLLKAVPSIDRIEVCFHAGANYGQPCECRKPKPGMMQQVGKDWNLDLEASFLIGDRWRDVNCARAGGCRAVFLDHGYDEELREAPHFVVRSFAEAVDVILREADVRLHSIPPE